MERLKDVNRDYNGIQKQENSSNTKTIEFIEYNTIQYNTTRYNSSHDKIKEQCINGSDGLITKDTIQYLFFFYFFFFFSHFEKNNTTTPFVWL